MNNEEDLKNDSKRSHGDLAKRYKFEKIVELKNLEKYKEPFVKSIKITDILTCVTTPGYIRFLCETDRDFTDLIPFIFLSYPPGLVNLSSKDQSLTIKIYDRMISFLPPNDIGVTNTPDENAAVEFVQILGDILNKAYNEMLTNPKPDINEINNAKRVKWTDVYKFLPKKNCKECGLPICSSFALSVIAGEKKLRDCPYLRKQPYKKKLLEFNKKFGTRLVKALGCECLDS
ncbi:MAG: (Fe-S)-binding protein [Promethearchaeota archaeon]